MSLAGRDSVLTVTVHHDVAVCEWTSGQTVISLSIIMPTLLRYYTIGVLYSGITFDT